MEYFLFSSLYDCDDLSNRVVSTDAIASAAAATIETTVMLIDNFYAQTSSRAFVFY